MTLAPSLPLLPLLYGKYVEEEFVVGDEDGDARVVVGGGVVGSSLLSLSLLLLPLLPLPLLLLVSYKLLTSAAGVVVVAVVFVAIGVSVSACVMCESA